MYTLHNVGDVGVNYEIDTRPLEELNQFNYSMIIFQCLQPKGLIAPHSSLPVEFVFSPLEAKQYTVRELVCVYVIVFMYLLKYSKFLII